MPKKPASGEMSRKKTEPLCQDWWNIGDHHDADISAVACELPLNHKGPHQETIRWQHAVSARGFDYIERV